MSAGPWDSLIVGAGAEAVRIRRMDALDFYGRGTVAVQPGAQVEVVLRSDYLTALAQRDAARDIAVRLEAQLAAVADLHRPQPIYDECERDCPDHGIPPELLHGLSGPNHRHGLPVLLPRRERRPDRGLRDLPRPHRAHVPDGRRVGDPGR